MEIYIIISFLAIAMLYSSVGFGGGSSYLAILALLGISFMEMRTISLSCNIIVILVNLYHHIKEKNIAWKPTLLICIFSVPLAYVGSLLKFKESTFLLILGCSLIVASMMMTLNFWWKKNESIQLAKNNILVIMIGGGIGFLSGITGIGGGIFLSPVLYLMKFDIPRKIAAIATIFIAVNSVSGIIGLIQKGNFHSDPKFFIPLLAAVLIGGYVGNKLRFKYLSASRLTILTALLILYVGIKLVIDNM